MVQTCLIFGSFDGIHEGHLYLLRWAQKRAHRLVVALATDNSIRTLKHLEPRHAFEERSSLLNATGLVSEIVNSNPNDDFQCIQHIQPQLIILGHDQDALKEHLLTWLKEHNTHIIVETAPAYQPDRFKTTLLYDRPKIDS